MYVLSMVRKCIVVKVEEDKEKEKGVEFINFAEIWGICNVQLCIIGLGGDGCL